MGLTFCDFFAGIGGFRIALESAGLQCVYACELDARCRKTYKERYGHEPQGSDIARLDPADIPDADLWCAGVPCQDLSVAGKRLGLDGHRSGLYFDFIRLVEARKPPQILLEEVTGLLSNHVGHDMETWLHGLAKLGYLGTYRVLNAELAGVPQRRRRVFTLAHSRTSCRRSVLFDAGGGPWDFEAGGKAGTIAAGELARSLGGVGGGNDYGANKGTLVSEKTTAFKRRGGYGWSETEETTLALESRQSRWGGPEEQLIQSVRSSEGDCLAFDGHYDPKPVFPTLKAGSSGGGKNELNLGVVSQPMAFETHVARNGRGAPDAVAPPVTAQAGADGRGDAQTMIVYPTLRSQVRNNSNPSTEASMLVASPITAGGHPNSNSPGRRREDDENLILVEGDSASSTPKLPRLRAGCGRGGETYLFRPFEKDRVGQAVSSKWSKGSSGPAGDEHHNLVLAVPDGVDVTAFDCKAGGNTGFAIGEYAGALRGEGHGGGHAAILVEQRSSSEEIHAIQGTEREKDQNGMGVRQGPMYSLTDKARHAIAFEPRYFTRERAGGKPSDSVGLTNTKRGGDASPLITTGPSMWDERGIHKISLSQSTSPTLNASIAPILVEPVLIRRITPTEAERLQGFPDGHTCLCGIRPDCPDRRIPPWVDPSKIKLGGCGHSACGCTCADGPRRKMLGNAIAVPVVYQLALKLRQDLEEAQSKE